MTTFGEPKEEIRSRLSIVDVASEYVELKRAGRNFKALSPFSDEKTPSLMISPDKQIWHDFSSNRGGDIFSFVMEVEGIGFRQALELLARKAGVELTLYDNEQAQKFHKKKERMYQALELATKFYQFALTKSKTAQKYWFEKRRFSQVIIDEFRLGYAPKDGKSLLQFLLKRGFSATELKEAGLIVQRRNGLGDMFRERVMVPLSDGQGRVVGFTARMLGEQKNAPKYINTPQTLLYDKGRQVFGFHLAKEAIRKEDYVVIVEGNLDVIASHMADERAVVATAGTAMTKDHLAALARLTPRIKLAFDRDRAGIAATERAIAIAGELDIELSIVDVPDGIKDPDELIQQDPKKWQEVIQNSTYAVDWVIARYEEICNLTTAEGKRTFTTKTLEVVQRLKDPVEQDHYKQLLAKKVAVSEDALHRKLQGMSKEQPKKQYRPVKPIIKEAPNKLELLEDDLLALMARFPAARDAFMRITPEDFFSEERQTVARYFFENRNEPLEIPLPNPLQNSETYGKIILLRAEERHSQHSQADAVQIAIELAIRIKKEKQKQIFQQLSHALAQAEHDKDKEKITALRTQINALIKEQHNG